MLGEIQPIWNAQLRGYADRLLAMVDKAARESIRGMIEGELYPSGITHAETLAWTNIFLRRRVEFMEAALHFLAAGQNTVSTAR
jgi:hypothetical protein